MKRIAALLTCHNRRDKTISCINALFANTLPVDVNLHVILVVDGCTDGTEEAVRERFPLVEIIKGDGNLFWNRGMHTAFAHALQLRFDAYLWLNDDTMLHQSALARMLNTWQATKSSTIPDAIIVGATQDPETSIPTYGGLLRHSALKRFRYTLVTPADVPVECQTMNGNCVLVPHSVAYRIGNLEPRFAHAMGDIDYGLRASMAGIKIFIAPGFVGLCSRNEVTGSFSDRTLSRVQRWKKIMQPKGLPPASWWVFTKRHGGLLAPVYWVWPYLSIWIM